MNVFAPFSTYWLPSSDNHAVVLMPARSEPVPGSVIAMARTMSPDAIAGNQRQRCSSLARFSR
jgi:hypothetical protein